MGRRIRGSFPSDIVLYWNHPMDYKRLFEDAGGAGMKTEWTAERNTLALLIPSKHKTAVKDIFALADKRDNGFVTIRISNVHRPRTGEGSQNHHINGLQQIATETGNP